MIVHARRRLPTHSPPYEHAGDDSRLPRDGQAVVLRPGPRSAVGVARIDPQSALPSQTRSFAFDAPAVSAAVEALPEAFELRPQADGRWTVDHAALKVRGELSVQADGVGARVDLAVRISDVDASSRALVLMSIGSVGVGGVAALLTAPLGSLAMSAMNLLGHVLAAAATFLAGLVVRELLSVWRRHQVRRWAHAYQRRLWPALDARLGRRIYR